MHLLDVLLTLRLGGEELFDVDGAQPVASEADPAGEARRRVAIEDLDLDGPSPGDGGSEQVDERLHAKSPICSLRASTKER